MPTHIHHTSMPSHSQPFLPMHAATYIHLTVLHCQTGRTGLSPMSWSSVPVQSTPSGTDWAHWGTAGCTCPSLDHRQKRTRPHPLTSSSRQRRIDRDESSPLLPWLARRGWGQEGGWGPPLVGQSGASEWEGREGARIGWVRMYEVEVTRARWGW